MPFVTHESWLTFHTDDPVKPSFFGEEEVTSRSNETFPVYFILVKVWVAQCYCGQARGSPSWHHSKRGLNGNAFNMFERHFEVLEQNTTGYVCRGLFICKFKHSKGIQTLCLSGFSMLDTNIFSIPTILLRLIILMIKVSVVSNPHVGSNIAMCEES